MVCLSAGFLAVPPGAAAQADGRPASWEIGVHAGALRVDDDFAAAFASGTGLVVGATAAWRPDPRVSLEIDAWRYADEGERDPLFDPLAGASIDALDLWGVGLTLGVAPLAGSRAVDPHLLFGLETIRAGDDEERSPAFVSGAGFRARLGGDWVARVDLRNHFLAIEEDEVDGVETGRDATLWELRVGVGLRLGGDAP